MRHQQDDKTSRRQKRNLKYLDDRYELLETIRMLIVDELDRRLGNGKGQESLGRSGRDNGSADQATPPPCNERGGSPPRTLFRRILDFLCRR